MTRPADPPSYPLERPCVDGAEKDMGQGKSRDPTDRDQGKPESPG